MERRTCQNCGMHCFAIEDHVRRVRICTYCDHESVMRSNFTSGNGDWLINLGMLSACECSGTTFKVTAITAHRNTAGLSCLCQRCQKETVKSFPIPDLVDVIGINCYQDLLATKPRLVIADRRQIEKEETKVEVSPNSKAVSSHQALFYHLIDPDTLERLAKRKTGGGIKYGTVQWRQGLNDVEYVTDRYNHFWQHLVNFQRDGNQFDDNIGGMLWALDALCAAERLCPDVLKQVVGTCHLYGEMATAYHEAEQKRRKQTQPKPFPEIPKNFVNKGD